MSLVRFYIRAFELNQGWNLFAPQPRKNNFYISARIQYSDGTSVDWIPAQNTQMDYVTRSFKWRYRKWESNLVDSRDLHMKADACRYALRQVPQQPGKVPEKVILTRHWVPIPAPDSKEQTLITRHAHLFTYSVASEDGL
jgi:hypothetical protein